MGQVLNSGAKVWITRTAPRDVHGVAAFDAAGFSAKAAPLLTVSFTNPPPSAPAKNATLIVTSQNGVEGFCAAHEARDYPVIAVGDATARYAHAQGFRAVQSAGGSAADVIALILDAPDPDTHYYHAAGRHQRGGIVEDLRDAGLSAERQVYYATAPVPAWAATPSARDIITLYSPRGAEALVATGLDLSEMIILSISPATRKAFGPAPCFAHIVASAPTELGMIEALRNARAQSRLGI